MTTACHEHIIIGKQDFLFVIVGIVVVVLFISGAPSALVRAGPTSVIQWSVLVIMVVVVAHAFAEVDAGRHVVVVLVLLLSSV